MLWNRAKTILILVFLLINIFLGTYLFVGQHNSNVQTVADLTAVLSRNDVTLKVTALPKTPDTVFVPEWNTPELTKKQIQEFISEPIETGEGYTNRERTSILNFSNNQFYYQNTAPNQKGFRSLSAKNAVSKLKKTLKTLGVHKWVYPLDIKEEKGAIKVTYGYRVNQRTLVGSELSVLVCPEGIREISGFWGIPHEKNGFSYRLSKMETILMSLTNTEEELEVTKIEPGYYLATYTDAMVSQAIPIYEIHTSRGVWMLDARDGVKNSERNLSSYEKGDAQ